MDGRLKQIFFFLLTSHKVLLRPAYYSKINTNRQMQLYWPRVHFHSIPRFSLFFWERSYHTYKIGPSINSLESRHTLKVNNNVFNNDFLKIAIFNNGIKLTYKVIVSCQTEKIYLSGKVKEANQSLKGFKYLIMVICIIIVLTNSLEENSSVGAILHHYCIRC